MIFWHLRYNMWPKHFRKTEFTNIHWNTCLIIMARWCIHWKSPNKLIYNKQSNVWYCFFRSYWHWQVSCDRFRVYCQLVLLTWQFGRELCLSFCILRNNALQGARTNSFRSFHNYSTIWRISLWKYQWSHSSTLGIL